MTQALREYKKIEYKLDQVTPINKYELNAYNVPLQVIQVCAERYLLRGSESWSSQ